MFPAYSRTRHCKNCAPRRTASVKMVFSKKAEFPCRHFSVFVSRAASAAVFFTDTFARGAGGRILHDIPRVVFHGGHKETAQSAPAHRWCLRANSPACAGTLCLHFRQFVVFRTKHDLRDNLCHAIMRTSEAPATPRRWTLVAGRSRLFLASGPRKNLRPAAHNARRREEKMVCCRRYRLLRVRQQSFWFWADRTPSVPAPYAVFAKARQ